MKTLLVIYPHIDVFPVSHFSRIMFFRDSIADIGADFSYHCSVNTNYHIRSTSNNIRVKRRPNQLCISNSYYPAVTQQLWDTYDHSWPTERQPYCDNMPGKKPVHLSLSEVLEVRNGPLTEDELWALLCEGAVAIQDLLINGR